MGGHLKGKNSILASLAGPDSADILAVRGTGIFSAVTALCSFVSAPVALILFCTFIFFCTIILFTATHNASFGLNDRFHICNISH
jgi:hypothetical protein